MQRNIKEDRNEEDHGMVERPEPEVSERWIQPDNGQCIPTEPNQPYFGTRKYNGKFHYIARYIANDIVPHIGSFVGPVDRTRGLLRVPGGNGNLNGPLTTNYQVLVVPPNAVRWVSINRDGTLPETVRALPTEITSENGMDVFIGRRGDVGVGMVCSDANFYLKFYSSASAHEYDADFEVLCVN